MRTLASLVWPRRCPALFMFSVLSGCGEPTPQFTEPMVLGGREVSPVELQRGLRVYSLYCVSCHAADGSGRGNAARSFSSPPRDFREADFKYVSGAPGSLPTDGDLDFTIRKGRPGTGMPPWDGLSSGDRDAVIQYLKTFSPRWTTEVSAGPKTAKS